MKIDKAKLEALAALPDDRLWATIRTIAAEHGLHLSGTAPSHEELEKLREVARNTEKLSLRDAVRIVNVLKKNRQ